jgi:hypothetical protein
MQTTTKHFSRSRTIFTALAAAMGLVDKEARAAALSSIPSYRSRGKGRDKSFLKIKRRVRNATTYFAVNQRNGAREVARRLRQIQRAQMKQLAI